MFNSQIELVSKPNVGTKILFDVVFNYESLPKTMVVDGMNQESDLGHLRILVVEDNEVNKLVIKQTLQRWNVLPVIVDNGAIAVQKIEEETFDLILMDLFMPVMDGFQATAAIRKLRDPMKSSIPIIALTAQVDENMVQKVLNATMNDFLSKPFDPNHLLEKLKMIADRNVELYS
ncbi:response regulator [Gelidibacter maritimus]|uniref:Response regulator n=1 Tax=Gelidibacter maritimus TaxID=2761487 RepID=A0A7W2M8R1_9FLAO|nr:response regulator [Gelidibacter maritimus]MBA6154816.1 response regulator [Gelidibacter maritimus]